MDEKKIKWGDIFFKFSTCWFLSTLIGLLSIFRDVRGHRQNWSKTVWDRGKIPQNINKCTFLLTFLCWTLVLISVHVIRSSKMSRHWQILFLRYNEAKPLVFFFFSFCFFNPSTAYIFWTHCTITIWGFHQIKA